MGKKKEKSIKHSLKTAIDRADNWIRIAYMENRFADTEDPNAFKTHATITFGLKKAREDVCNEYNRFLAEIDKALDSISKID